MAISREENFKAITEWLKANVPADIPVLSMVSLIDGNVTIQEKKGVAKITISIPLDDIMEKPYDAMKILRNDLKLVPIILFMDGEILQK